MGFGGIINLCPLRALCQKIFPASLNFSPEVYSFIDNTIQKAIAYGVATKIGHVPALYPKFITAGLRRNKENLRRVSWIGER